MFHTRIVQKVSSKTEQDAAADRHAGLALVPRGAQAKPSSLRAWPELASITLRRCSAFFAEAAVLVLVFGVLDYLIQRGHIESGWVFGALLISVALLAASVGTEFGARRWLGAQP